MDERHVAIASSLQGAAWRKGVRSDTEGNQCVEVASVWRKSSRSNTQGNQCVEVASSWRKSSRSDTHGAQCVEVAATSRRVAVRDSTHPDGPALLLTGRAWNAFTTGIRAGTYDT